MQRLLYSIFLSFFIFISCSKRKPDGILSESKIIDVLTEVSLVDGYLNTIPNDSSQRMMPALYDVIFKKYKIDSATFVKNLDFYFADPNLTEKIYLVVNDNLNKYDRTYAIQDSIQMAFRQDSIGRVRFYERLNSKIENLKHFNASDTGYKNFYDFNKRIVSRSNLDFLNTDYGLHSYTPMFNDRLVVNNDYKSTYIFIDTLHTDSLVGSKYKINSEEFLNRIKVTSKSIQKNKIKNKKVISDEPVEIMFDRGEGSGVKKHKDTSKLENKQGSRLPKLDTGNPAVKPVTK